MYKCTFVSLARFFILSFVFVRYFFILSSPSERRASVHLDTKHVVCFLKSINSSYLIIAHNFIINATSTADKQQDETTKKHQNRSVCVLFIRTISLIADASHFHYSFRSCFCGRFCKRFETHFFFSVLPFETI